VTGRRVQSDPVKHTHVYRKGRGNVDVCECGRFQFNEKAGAPIEEQRAQTPARCTKCVWVHEMDSTAGTSFFGVGLCPLHASAPDLLKAAKEIKAWIEKANPEHVQGTAYIELALMDAIAKAE
jgi:hypothetical protein